jgi:hypothetical protein
MPITPAYEWIIDRTGGHQDRITARFSRMSPDGSAFFYDDPTWTEGGFVQAYAAGQVTAIHRGAEQTT